MTAWIIVAVLALLLIWLFVTCRKGQAARVHLENKVTHLQDQVTDISDQLQTAEAFLVARNRLSKDAIIYLDAGQHIQSANYPARQMFGEVTEGTTLVAWTKYHYLSEIVSQTATVPGHITQQFEYESKIFQVRAMAVQRDDILLGSVLFLRDVSELQRLGRARRDLVANISHDLRTPISGIRLVAETLDKGAINNAKVAPGMIQRILMETETLEQINEELMDLSMIESGRVLLKLQPLNLTKRVNKVVKSLQSQANRKKIDLIIDMKSKVQVLGDKHMLSRVLTNLIHNAIKFTQEGQVVIQAEYNTADEMICVSVSDTGTGIARENQPRIFERFYRSDNARVRDADEPVDRKETGTGLGLAIAKHIVEAHGGQIWVASALGQGSTFYFTLPPEEIAPTLTE